MFHITISIILLHTLLHAVECSNIISINLLHNSGMRKKKLEEQSWALEVFFNFFNNKNCFFAFFYQVNNLFLHQSYLKIMYLFMYLCYYIF